MWTGQLIIGIYQWIYKHQWLEYEYLEVDIVNMDLNPCELMQAKIILIKVLIEWQHSVDIFFKIERVVSVTVTGPSGTSYFPSVMLFKWHCHHNFLAYFGTIWTWWSVFPSAMCSISVRRLQMVLFSHQQLFLGLNFWPLRCSHYSSTYKFTMVARQNQW